MLTDDVHHHSTVTELDNSGHVIAYLLLLTSLQFRRTFALARVKKKTFFLSIPKSVINETGAGLKENFLFIICSSM